MNPQTVICPNIDCPARGLTGKGNIGVHETKESRYMCHRCKRAFSATQGTLFYRLRTDATTVLLVFTLLAYGCPLQAIVKAFGFDERTVKKWWRRSGEHCRVVHEHMIEQRELDLQQVQADEIKARLQGASVWMAMAIMVPTRLWLGGVVSARRDHALIEQLAAKICGMALCRPLLLAVDGLASYVSAFRDAFRSSMSSSFLAHSHLVYINSFGCIQNWLTPAVGARGGAVTKGRHVASVCPPHLMPVRVIQTDFEYTQFVLERCP